MHCWRGAAAAHGVVGFSGLRDISVSYAGQWHALVGSIQPALVDAGHRGGSQERLLLGERIVAQAHTGPKGTKQVFRQQGQASQGSVKVWFDGQPSHDPDSLHAAALVADGYSLFLLGPMLVADAWRTDRAMTLRTGVRGADHRV